MSFNTDAPSSDRSSDSGALEGSGGVEGHGPEALGAAGGCDEYLSMSRRGFIGAGAAAAAAAVTAPAWLPRMSFAADFNTPPQDVFVCIFLRGAADGLNMCIPFNDPGYIAARSTLRVYAPDDVSQAVGHRALPLNNATYGSVSLGLHPAMSALLPAYNDGKLVMAHCSGLTGANKSHFDAQRFMERGKWNDPDLITGWLGRNLANNAPINQSSLVRGIAVANGVQMSLLGGPQTLPVPEFASNPGSPDATGLVAMNNLRNYGLAGSSSTRTARRQALNRILTDPLTVPPGMYEPSEPQKIRDSAQSTVNIIARLNQIGAASYRPAGNAVYPSNGFGYSMMTSAAMIVANDLSTGGQAVDAIAIDLGGWDTHTDEQRRDTTTGTITGNMVNQMQQLAGGLGAFYADVIASRQRNVTVVVMSEFGRRVGENGGDAGSAPGTDHGYGNVMWVMGKNVLGGRVLTKASAAAAGFGWPGVPLAVGNTRAYDLDMPITLDYRHLLAEVVDRRLNNAAGLSTIFPGFTPSYQGIVS